jgi:hypothetical protein
VGDYFIVTFGEQGEARLPASEVDMCCATLEEAYLLKRDRIRDGDLSAHLELANWCLRQKLNDRAADQTLAALALDPTNSRVAALDRRLQQAAAPVVRADSTANAVVDTSPFEEVPLHRLPAGTVEQFTQKVQPVLLNRCATNACHGVRSRQAFQLLRPLRGQSVPHRLTQRNLQAALAMVNTRQPESSQLVTVPSRPHGGLELPLFGERELAQYQQLLDWARHLADAPPPTDPPTNVASRVPAPQAGIFQPSPKAAAFFQGAKEGSSISPEPTANGQAPQSLPAREPEDPFDPEEFNRRYLDEQ